MSTYKRMPPEVAKAVNDNIEKRLAERKAKYTAAQDLEIIPDNHNRPYMFTNMEILAIQRALLGAYKLTKEKGWKLTNRPVINGIKYKVDFYEADFEHVSKKVYDQIQIQLEDLAVYETGETPSGDISDEERTED